MSRLDTLKAGGDPIQLRYREHDERPRALAAIREVFSSFMEKAQSGDEKYSHIPEKDITTVIETIANAENWLSNLVARQAERPNDLKPVVTSAEIMKRKDECVPAPLAAPADALQHVCHRQPVDVEAPPKAQGRGDQDGKEGRALCRRYARRGDADGGGRARGHRRGGHRRRTGVDGGRRCGLNDELDSLGCNNRTVFRSRACPVDRE